MKILQICFLNELRKLKGTLALWLTLISALFIPFIYFLFYFLKSSEPITGEGVNPWDKFFGLHLMAAGPFLIPLFIVLLVSLVLQVEHKSDGIRQIYSLPVPRWGFYGSKMAVVILMVLLSYSIFFICILGSGFLLGETRPHLDLHLYEPNYLLYIKALFRSLVAVMGVISIQFWLSFSIRNFIVPLGIGVVLVVTAMTIHRAEEAIFFPYAYNLLNLFNADPPNLQWFTQASLYSLVVFFLTALVGYFHTARMNINK